jgi:ABC-type polysaccharide/polyol phosphate export permease
VLPFVVVLANLVHFVLGLPILFGFLLYYGKIQISIIFFPGIVFLQLVFTLGVCLFVSALAVHFRDVQNLMGNLIMFWFFSSPIIYSYLHIPPTTQSWLNYNPMTHIMVGYHQTLFFGGLGHWPWLLVMVAVSIIVFLIGYFFFDRMRDTFAEEV